MPARDLFRTLRSAAIDLAFPPVCAGCEKVGPFLCDTCVASLPAADGRRCPCCWDSVAFDGVCGHCRDATPAFTALRAPFQMAGVARDTVHRLKYGGLAAAGPTLAGHMAAAWPGWSLDADVVVPVPLHPRRERVRGYNQAAALAKPLAGLLGLPFVAGALVRARGTPPLASGLGRVERLRAMAGAFAPGPVAASLPGRRALLVDDVATTGATLSAAAQALRAAGAADVIACVFARDGVAPVVPS